MGQGCFGRECAMVSGKQSVVQLKRQKQKFPSGFSLEIVERHYKLMDYRNHEPRVRLQNNIVKMHDGHSYTYLNIEFVLDK